MHRIALLEIVQLGATVLGPSGAPSARIYVVRPPLPPSLPTAVHSSGHGVGKAL